ncbi:hypothetical protein Hanom_Chr15g01397801 [Helianthus anomalus]
MLFERYRSVQIVTVSVQIFSYRYNQSCINEKIETENHKMNTCFSIDVVWYGTQAMRCQFLKEKSVK